MDESHDQNSVCKVLKICCKTCVFCCKTYPIPTTILTLFFLLHLFFPLVFKYLIYSSPLFVLSLFVHRHFFGTNSQTIKHDEIDDRRRKFAKSRRSFKSRNHLTRRNTLNRSGSNIDTNDDDKDNIFVKSLNDLLSEKKAKDKPDISFQSIGGKGECSSSSKGKVNIDNDVSEKNGKPQDNKVVRWTEDDEKNEMDLELLEADRNKRLESLMVRRRSRKNLGFEDNNVQIPAVKTMKINPFLENNSSGKIPPGSAPSSLLTTINPFDLPYDPHEEKLDLTGDNFHEEFTVGGQSKEPMFCRHQSFCIGAFSHEKHDNKLMQQDSPISDDSIDSNHPNEEGTSSEPATGIVNEDGTEINQQETDSFDERKADINFFYGTNKRVHHVASNSIYSDLQVELSDDGTDHALDDIDIEKDRQSLLNSSGLQGDSEEPVAPASRFKEM